MAAAPYDLLLYGAVCKCVLIYLLKLKENKWIEINSVYRWGEKNYLEAIERTT